MNFRKWIMLPITTWSLYNVYYNYWPTTYWQAAVGTVGLIIGLELVDFLISRLIKRVEGAITLCTFVLGSLIAMSPMLVSGRRKEQARKHENSPK